MQKKDRTVVFLGAGASAADGAPIQGQLFTRYFHPPAGKRPAIDPLLATFFDAFYNIDVHRVDSNTRFPTFEEVLGTLELALQCGDHYRVSRKTWAEDRIRECREQIIFLICTVLRDALGQDKPIGTTWHLRLLQALNGNPSIDFLSLNYDLLVDNAIKGAFGTPQYGAEFANRIDRLGPDTALFKLHGSLNWLRCPTCGSLTYTGNDKAASYPIETRPKCAQPECLGNTTPIVIPPTFFKVMDNFHLQGIWHRAYLALLHARRIVFCGYSLPDADMHVRYLLKRVEVNSQSTPEVVIVSNHQGKKSAQKSAEKERYQRLFRDPSRVAFTSLSFEQFARAPQRVLASPLSKLV